MVSWPALARANSPWQDPGDVQGWVNNATSSLSNLVSTYSLAGIDIDYEAGVDSTFVTAMSQVISNLRGEYPEMWIMFAPFGQTWPVYRGSFRGCRFNFI